MKWLAVVLTVVILLTPVKSAVIKGNVYSWELMMINAVV